MSGHRGNIGSRPPREIFLTSSSLSFSSLSSSVSCDDAIELNTKESKASREDKIQKNGELLNASSSHGSEMSSITHVRMQPAPSPPSRLQPVPFMDTGIWDYDPQRIPASAFGKTGDMTWSEISNESLFSLKFDGYRKSNAQASRQSNIKAEEILMSGEYLKYTPSLLVKPGDAEPKRSEVKEIKSGETRVESRLEEKSSSTPDVSLSTNPNNSYSLSQVPPTKDQSCSLLVGEGKSKKRKKTRKSKKKKKKKAKKKEKKKCCIWSWLCSVVSKCECDLRCYKWGKCSCCCRGPKTMVL